MLTHVLRMTFRTLRTHAAFSLMNIAGLSVGLACCIVIMLYVLHETAYDRHHANVDRIMRVRYTLNLNGIVYDEASIPFPAAHAFTQDFPAVKLAVRLYHDTEPALITLGNRKFTEERFFFADSGIFAMFDFPFLRGDAATALRDPQSVVLTSEMAHKYFGDDDPVGKYLRYNNSADLKVTGVVSALPSTTHFHFDLLAPLSYQLLAWERVSGQEGREKKWFWTGAWTYLLLAHPEDASLLASQLPGFVRRHIPDRLKGGTTLSLQALKDIHLYSHLDNEIEPNGNIVSVVMFSAIALLVLAIACINFVNLSTARASTRAKEIGIRKVVGAGRLHLAGQILGETAITSVLAMACSVALVEILLPRFNELAGRHLEFGITDDWRVSLALIGLIAMTVALAGVYPAILLSKFDIIGMFRKQSPLSASHGGFRKTLVAVQFTVSIILIAGILVVYQQLKFMQQKELGFTKNRVMCLKSSLEINSRFETFRAAVMNQQGVVGVSSTSNIPGEGAYGYRFVPEGIPRTQPVMLPLLLTDLDFVKTMDIKVAKGRSLSRMMPADTSEGFLLNESAARQLGWGENAVGKKLELFRAGEDEIERSGYVVGIIRDFHYESLHHEVKPLVIAYSNAPSYYIIRFGPGDVTGRLANIERLWNEMSPGWPMQYSFLDRKLDSLYGSEQTLVDLIGYFSLIAIMVACLGLLGLSIFAAERRTKEIGIRKVLGASIPGLLVLLSKEFTVLLLISNAIAWPVAYYLATEWLGSFAYRIDLSPFVFVLAGSIALLVALATVGTQAVKAALANPVQSLRYE